MNITDIRPLVCPVCGVPMRCVLIEQDMIFDGKLEVMWRCDSRHTFRGRFEEKELEVAE